MFITFEGTEGCGKSTALRGVSRVLAERGENPFCTREPGGSALGRHLRSLLLGREFRIDAQAELFLFLADRAQHVTECIRPALAEGRTVLCDRYMDSTMAYQGCARHIDLDVLSGMNMLATGWLEPDLTLLLDLPVEEGLRRVAKRRHSQGDESEDRFEEETLAFHEAVRQGFLRIADTAPSRVCVIDAALPEEEVLASCLRAIDRRAGR